MHYDYLNNTGSYTALEKLFLDTFVQCVGEKESSEQVNQSHFAAPFYKTTYGNGQPFADGNPIFSAKNTQKK